MLASIVQGLIDLVASLVGLLIDFLPSSPFSGIFDYISTINILGYINYFVPVGTMCTIGSLWLACIVIYYVYKAIINIVKLG